MKNDSCESTVGMAYKLLRIEDLPNGNSELSYDEALIGELHPGQIYIRTLFSTINFKDLLRIKRVPGLANSQSNVPGIDAVGVVTNLRPPSSFKVGDYVLITTSKYGISKSGSYSQYMKIESSDALTLPKQMSPFFSMFLGTAGLTAAHITKLILQEDKQVKDQSVYVNGASSAVGMFTTCLLTNLGYKVTAGIRSPRWSQLLLNIGAEEVKIKSDGLKASSFQILPARWSIVVDTLGGEDLTWLAASTREGGIIYQTGNVLGNNSNLSLAPFYTRGISIRGIATELLAPEERVVLWNLLATDWQSAFRVAINSSTVVSFMNLKDHLSSVGLKERTFIKTVIDFR